MRELLNFLPVMAIGFITVAIGVYYLVKPLDGHHHKSHHGKN